MRAKSLAVNVLKGWSTELGRIAPVLWKSIKFDCLSGGITFVNW